MQTDMKYRVGYAKHRFDPGYGKVEITTRPAVFKLGRSGKWLFWGYSDTIEQAEAKAARCNGQPL